MSLLALMVMLLLLYRPDKSYLRNARQDTPLVHQTSRRYGNLKNDKFISKCMWNL